MPLMQAWLQQNMEAAIDPGVPLIDPHHHLWPEHPVRHYSYLDGDLASDIATGHRVLATVFLQCRSMYRAAGPEHMKPVGEVEWVESVAARHEREHPRAPAIAAGIVGFADLMLGERVAEVLDAMQLASPARFKGIRNGSTWSAEKEIVGEGYVYPPGMLLDPAFRKGFAQLARRGLSFDAWMFHPQLPELVDLARAFPDTTIVLNHLGAPLGKGSYANRGQAVFEEWRKSIAELARCPNVCMKLGGAVMPMFGYGWERRPLPPSSDELVAATGHYYHAAIEAFGPARCMFESNFPVDKHACSYVNLWNSFKKLAARYTQSERADMLMHTAARIYRLDAVALLARD